MSLYNGASGSNFREYANNGRFNASTSQTVAIWVRPAAAAAAQWAYVARGVGTTGGDWTLGTPVGASSLSRAQVITSSGSQNLADVINWVNGKWQHVCQTFDGTVLRIYIDGAQRATLTVAGTFTQTSTSNIRLWMRTDATIVADCALEQFGWWRTCFSAAEVDALSRGADFTKIRRDDALILDPLNDINGIDLVAGLGVNTGTLSVREKAPILGRPPLITLARPKDIRGATRKRYNIGVTAAGNVTVAITGAVITSAAGLLVPSTAVPAVGAVITSAAGTTTPSTTVAQTGAVITSTAGTVTENHPSTVAATGVAITSAAGSVVPSTTVAQAGAAIASAAGAVTPATSVAQAGAAVTASAGSVVPSTTVAAAGSASTFTPGLVSASSPGSATLAGSVITSAAGTIAPSTSLALAGASITSHAGTPAPATALPIAGAAITSAAGTVGAAVTVGIAGAVITAAAGTVTGVAPGGDVTVAITGASATFTPGAVAVSGGDTSIVYVYRTVSTVLAQFDVNLALVSGASSSTGGLRAAGHRFTLEKEPLPQMDGDYFLDVEAITPGQRNRIVGEAYWEATVVVRVGYYRGGGDAAGGDRQSVMRDASSDAMRLADVLENPTNYASATTGISEVRYQSAVRAATFNRGEIWETRLLVRWRSDSFTG